MENKMFCYQCQETAQGRGCTVAGVCGKNAEVAAMQDLLIYVTKGLSAVTTALREQGVSIDASVNHLVTMNLFTTITNANFDEDSIRARIWLLTLSMQMRFLRTMKKLMLSSSLLWLRHWTTA